MTVRVAILDDHPIVIGGLEAAVASADDIEIVARAGTIGKARAILARDDIDVVLLDIRLADGNSLQLLEGRAEPAPPGVLVLSSFDARQYVAAALRLGAAGFLLKTTPVEDLLDAIRQIARGGSIFTAEQLRIGRSGVVRLTSREREVLRLLLIGYSNREIAVEIGAASKTVEAHLARMFVRFGVSTRTELALAAEREGWLDVVAEG